MDSSSNSDVPNMPFMGPSSYDFSLQSTNCLDELRSGQAVKLVVPHFGEVGIGSIVDVHPSRQWLGVTILAFSAKFILVRPSTIVPVAENLFLESCQRGYTILRDTLIWTILWRAGDALALSKDLSMDVVDYVHPKSWIGLEVDWLDPSGVLLA